ncbi:hypothetical protein [Streptomyces sp. NPDC101455]|uniref:hypothetical protein n=1 Tax=Streptomyces sp. NPDC101455 TaxID=3366142 RepID=UPI0038047F2D
MAAPDLGDERWSQLLGRRVAHRVKQTAIRSGNILVKLSGSSALVDGYVEKALDRARVER